MTDNPPGKKRTCPLCGERIRAHLPNHVVKEHAEEQ